MLKELTNKEAQNDLITVEMLYNRMEGNEDNPGTYFSLKMQADKAMSDWKAKYPEADKERRYFNLIESAENKEILATKAGIYGDSESREERISSFTAEAIELRRLADEIFEEKTEEKLEIKKMENLTIAEHYLEIEKMNVNAETTIELPKPIYFYKDETGERIYKEFEDGTITDNTGDWYASREELTDEDGNRLDIEGDAFGWCIQQELIS